MTADQPFTAFYTLELRHRLAALDRDQLLTLFTLCAYANRSGVCWPKIRDLQQDTALTIDKVYTALEGLEASGFFLYVRRDAHDSVTGQQLPNAYAMNPAFVLVPEPDSEMGYITIRNITKKPDRYYASAPIHNQNQKTRIKKPEESSSLTESLEQSESIESKASEKAALNQADRPHATPEKPKTPHADRPGRSENQKQKGESPAAAHVVPAAPPPRRRAKPEPSSLRRYKTALAAPQEALAVQLAAEARDLTLECARMLVDCYDQTTIHAALIKFFEYKGEIGNKGGYLRRLIRRMSGDPDSTDYYASFSREES